MAVNNSIVQQKALPDKPITYQVNGADVKLSPSIVRAYLTNGNGNVTDQEVTYFINLCKYQKLNPLVKEAYLIKYGNQPATMVTSKEALLKRAMRNPRYKGHEAGVIVRNRETRVLEYRSGSFALPDEDLIGGWARAYVDGYQVPIEAAVSFREYAGTKGDGSLNSMWSGKPGTMIRKVALTTALREAFPDDLNGMYAAEEVGAEVDETSVPDVPVEPETPQEPEPQPDTPPMEFEDYSQIPPDFDNPPMDEIPNF